MAKPNPKRWFPSEFTARIALRKVDRYAERQQAYKPYFESWEAAHAHMLTGARRRLERARAELKRAERRLASVTAMQPPNDQAQGRPE